MKYRWSLAPAQPLLAGQLARQLNLSPLLAQCLLNRGLSRPEEISSFLDPRLKQLADPFLLPNMDRAVTRLFQAREAKESVVIFGDYDVDGVTSTALLLGVLGQLGWTTHSYLPHRLEEGYGLSREAVENCLCLKKVSAGLLLAVDCGSTAGDTIRWLKERSVDVIVLDHHQVSDPAPEPIALVNPHLQSRESNVESRKRGGGELSTLDPRPSTVFTELCSVGLAFKLAHALVKRGRETGLPGVADFDVRSLLDLVALGTIADIVPLTGENRILVSAGLERLNGTQRPGLVALKRTAQSRTPLGVYEVGFQLGPRLNAAGRLETAEAALQLLLARDLSEAMPIAQNLNSQNHERQAIERRMVEEVIGALRAKFNAETDLVIVEGQLLWHVGVVGIVASRVLQEFYRPTIILGGPAERDAEWRGSGRSIAGFDLAAALSQCSDLLVRHGGHAMAAGLSIHAANVDAFRHRINDIARRALKPEMLQPPLAVDAEVDLREFTLDGLHHLDRLQPTGQGNSAAHFCARNLTHQRPLQRIGSEKQHVKMWVTDGRDTHEAIWWGAGKGSLPVGRFDLAFAPRINQFNNQQLVQLKVLDWRPAG